MSEQRNEPETGQTGCEHPRQAEPKQGRSGALAQEPGNVEHGDGWENQGGGSVGQQQERERSGPE